MGINLPHSFVFSQARALQNQDLQDQNAKLVNYSHFVWGPLIEVVIDSS